jgi:hypothetical protein
LISLAHYRPDQLRTRGHAGFGEHVPEVEGESERFDLGRALLGAGAVSCLNGGGGGRRS